MRESTWSGFGSRSLAVAALYSRPRGFAPLTVVALLAGRFFPRSLAVAALYSRPRGFAPLTVVAILAPWLLFPNGRRVAVR